MTITGLKAGDIVRVNRHGWRFHGLVMGMEDRRVTFEPLEKQIPFRSASSREIIGIWRATKSTREGT